MPQVNMLQFDYYYILLVFTSLFVTASLGQNQNQWLKYQDQRPHTLQQPDYEYERIRPSRTDPFPVISSGLRTRHSQIPLSPILRTQHLFTMRTNDTTFGFEIFKDPMTRDVTIDYKINVIIERLTWTKPYYRNKDENPHSSPRILIEGFTAENKFKQMMSGYEIDNLINDFQTVLELMDDVTSVNISALGDWTDILVNAQLVASIYYDVPDSCDNCPGNYFCCGTGTCSTGQRNVIQNHNKGLYRCIPISGQNWDRNTETICNKHPNCGFYCNLDESPEKCSTGFNGDSCFGGDCNLANVALRIAVLVIFCFLLPPVIILFLCRFTAFRSACERVRTRWMNRGHRDSEVTIGEAAEPTVATISRQDRRRAHSFSPEDDPPPSYEEFLRHLKETDNHTPLYNEVFPAATGNVNANPVTVSTSANSYDSGIEEPRPYPALVHRRSFQEGSDTRDLDAVPINVNGPSSLRLGYPDQTGALSLGQGATGGVSNLGFIGEERTESNS